MTINQISQKIKYIIQTLTEHRNQRILDETLKIAQLNEITMKELADLIYKNNNQNITSNGVITNH